MRDCRLRRLEDLEGRASLPCTVGRRRELSADIEAPTCWATAAILKLP